MPCCHSCQYKESLWEHYGNDISSLSNEILLEEWQDDFIDFENDIDQKFKI